MEYQVYKMKYEYKYVVPNSLQDELRKRIRPFLQDDSNMNFGGPMGYTVRSIYYDTPKFDFYNEKVDGLKVRKKIRIRGYNTEDPKNIVYLEIKRKYEKKLRKNRSAVYYCDLKSFLNSDDPEKFIITGKGLKNAIEDSRRFLYHVVQHNLQPLVLVIYDREAYFGKFDPTLRITFDKNLRSSIHTDTEGLYNEHNIKYSIPNHFIFEVKFYDIYPSWLKPINAELGITLKAFSKFTTCIDEHIYVANNAKLMKHDFRQSVYM